MSQQAAGHWHCRAPPGPPGEAAAVGGFCSCKTSTSGKVPPGPHSSPELGGSSQAPGGGYCHLGGQGSLLENFSPGTLLGETYVANYNSSSVPGTGSALPLRTPGPRASGAEGQHLQRMAVPLPPPSPGDAGAGTHKGRILHHSPPPSRPSQEPLPAAQGRRAGDLGTELLPAAGQGAGLPCQPAHGDPAAPQPHPMGQRSGSPPACGTTVAARSGDSPTNPGGATRRGFCTFTLCLRALEPIFPPRWGAASPGPCTMLRMEREEGHESWRPSLTSPKGMKTLP